MDVLSDVLLSVRLAGAAFFTVDVRAPFLVELPPAEVVAGGRIDWAGRVLSFHVVAEGSCWVETVELPAPPVPLGAGDMVVLPGGDANVLASAPGLRSNPDVLSSVRHPDQAQPFTLRCGPDLRGDRAHIVCGFLGCTSQPFNPLLESLPRVVHAPVSAESRRWVTGLLDAAARSGEGAGREAMLTKLAELMFIEALRNHLAALPDDERGWLAALRDPLVGAALHLMHAQPAHPWTLERLAAAVCLSRSSLAQRFTSFVGVPPMHYLTRWRLDLAARMLESGSASVAQVASAVGYQSEAAFNRAFKRQVGAAPGAWRRGAGAAWRAQDTGAGVWSTTSQETDEQWD